MKQSLRKTHNTIWKVMMVLIPVIVLIAIVIRQNPAALNQPVQIAPPPAGETETGSGS